MKRISPRWRWTRGTAAGPRPRRPPAAAATTRAAAARRRRRRRVRSCASAEVKGGGATFPAAFYDQVSQRLPVRERRRHRPLQPARLGRRCQQFGGRAPCDFAGSDGLPKPEETSTRARSSTSRRWRLRSRSRTTSSGVDDLQARRPRRSPRSSRARSRPGTTRRSRPTTPTPTCPTPTITCRAPVGGLRHHRELHQVPDQGRARRLGRSATRQVDAGRRTTKAARATPAWPRASRTPTAPSATSTSPTPRRPA